MAYVDKTAWGGGCLREEQSLSSASRGQKPSSGPALLAWADHTYLEKQYM